MSRRLNRRAPRRSEPRNYLYGADPAAAEAAVAALTLEGWWEAPYTNTGSGAQTWTGKASAGGSGSRNLTQSTFANAPGTGTAVNGHTPALFDATNDYLTGANWSTYVTTSSIFIALLLRAETITKNNANSYDNEGLVATNSSNRFAVMLKPGLVVVRRFNGATSAEVTKALTVGAGGGWTALFIRLDGAAVEIAQNGAAYTSQALTGPDSLAFALLVGCTASNIGTDSLDGSIAGLILASHAVGAAENVAAIRAHWQLRFGVSV